MKKIKIKSTIWIGISMLLYTISLIWNFQSNAGYDIIIYAVGSILSLLYFIAGGVMK